MSNIEKLIEQQNELSAKAANAKATLAELEATPPSSLEDVAKLQTAKVSLFDLEIAAAENAIKLSNLQQAEAPDSFDELEQTVADTISKVKKQLNTAGISIEVMPSYGIDSAAAERQFVNGFVMISSKVKKAQAELNEVKQFKQQSQQTHGRLEANLAVAQRNKAEFFSKMIS